VDVALTTSISLAIALGISYTELAANYEFVTGKDIRDFLENQETQKKHKGKSKLPLFPPASQNKRK
jgi:hypothetical protein